MLTLLNWLRFFCPFVSPDLDRWELVRISLLPRQGSDLSGAKRANVIRGSATSRRISGRLRIVENPGEIDNCAAYCRSGTDNAVEPDMYAGDSKLLSLSALCGGMIIDQLRCINSHFSLGFGPRFNRGARFLRRHQYDIR